MDFQNVITGFSKSDRPYAQIMGRTNRDAIVGLKRNYPDALDALAFNLLKNFVTLNEFSKEQYAMYQRGIADFGSAMDECVRESEAEAMETKGLTEDVSPV